MEAILHLAVSLYTLHADELMLALLACTLLLMIAALAAVRRCRKQIRELAEKTKEMTKVALSQSGKTSRQEEAAGYLPVKTAGSAPSAVTRKNEEVFGSVIQEIFP